MTLPSATLFPQALLPLYIFEPRYRQMLADTLKHNRMFSVAMQKPGRTRETPCPVAGLGLIRPRELEKVAVEVRKDEQRPTLDQASDAPAVPPTPPQE